MYDGPVPVNRKWKSRSKSKRGRRAVTKAAGKSFESDFVMVFTLQGGKVATFREFTDSAGINAAFA